MGNAEKFTKSVNMEPEDLKNKLAIARLNSISVVIVCLTKTHWCDITHSLSYESVRI